MNQQWSSAGICVEPHSEQRSLGTSQQAGKEEEEAAQSSSSLIAVESASPTSSGSLGSSSVHQQQHLETDFPTCSSFASSATTSVVDVTVARSSNTPVSIDTAISLSASSNTLRASAAALLSQAVIANGVSEVSTKHTHPSSSHNTDLFSGSYKQERCASDTSPAGCSTSNIAGAALLKDDHTTASTSTSFCGGIDQKKTRITRRLCSLLLPTSDSIRLLRIAQKQPITLKRLGIVSVKAGDSDLVPIVVSNAALSLLSLNHLKATTSSQMHTIASVAPTANNNPMATEERAPIFDILQNESDRHELTPSTSTGRLAGKRKAAPFECDMYQIPGALAPGTQPRLDIGAQTAVPTVTVKQQPPSASNTNSPLLVNLLRSTSPGAGAGVHNNPHHIQYQRPPANQMVQHVPNTTPVPNQGYSSYPPYMSQMPVGVPPSSTGHMRLAATPQEASQLTTSHSEQSQQQQLAHQQMRSMPHEMDRQQHMLVTQQPQQQHQGPQAQQLSHSYFPPPQYNQRRPMIPQGYAIRGQMPAQQQQQQVQQHQASMYGPGGQSIRHQYVVHQPRMPPGHPMQYHQGLSEQDVAVAPQPVSSAPVPPPKKRKRPTKKQLREAEIAAQQQQQQQFLLEQQMNSRVPPANAHTVDRPNIMPQMMQSGQPHNTMVYTQHSQGYPHNLRSPPTASAQGGAMIQNQQPNQFYQQQSMWMPQHQQQMMQQQRPGQIAYTQMPQQWQGNQPHQRVVYPQTDVTDMNAGTSGSVQTSPMNSRNASIDYSPASQSSNTMSPIYQQTQGIIYQQQQQQQPHQMQMSMQMQLQQQRHQQQQQQMQMQMHISYMNDDSHLKNRVLQNVAEYGIHDELGANIADDGGDYNDLDSIEPMTESGDVSAALMASQLQQQQQQSNPLNCHQEQLYYSRMVVPQQQSNRYEIQQQQQGVGFARQLVDTNVMTKTRQAVASFQTQGYTLPSAAMAGPSGQASGDSCGQFFNPQSNCPQSVEQSGMVTQRHHTTARSLPAASPLSQHQQPSQSINVPPSSVPPLGGSSQFHQASGMRCDDLRSCRSDGEITPQASNVHSNISPDGDKDPINLTIDAVVMRALSDQEGLSVVSIGNGGNCVKNCNSRARITAADSTSSNAAQLATKTIGSELESGPASAHNGQSGPISSPSVMRNVAINQLATSSVNVQSTTADGGIEHGLSSNKLKEQRFFEVSKLRTDDKGNKLVEQHLLTNGHGSMPVKDLGGFYQQCNGMPPPQQQQQQTHYMGDEVRRITKRSSPNNAQPTGQRRNRRKADLSQEPSPHNPEDDELNITTTFANVTGASYTMSYGRRVNAVGGGGIVRSSPSPTQAPIPNVNVQNAHGGFSASMPRPPKILKNQHPKTS